MVGLKRLERLWLHDTKVTDAAVESLKQLKGLRQLLIYDAGFTRKGFDELSAALPRCLILYEVGAAKKEN